jgi:hypothetical protein
MSSSIEELWHEEKQTRKKLLRSFLLIGLGILLLITGFCFWITQPLIFTPKNNSLKVEINPERLKNHVETLSEKFHPRSASQTENLNKTADYIREEFIKAGAKISEQSFQVNGSTYRNIIANFGDETKEKIVVGAHYDSAFQTHGADDNASGVAGLIELAFLLGKTNSTANIELVAYTLEEPPYFATEQMGSYVHAKSLKEKNVSVRLMISMEMIGYFSDEPNSQKFPVSLMTLFYPNRGNFIAVVGNFTNGLTARSFKNSMTGVTDLPVYSINAPTFINGVDFSDHRNYWKFGYNALMITDTAFYRNTNYHTERDTAEKLDYAKMAEVVKATYNAVLEVAK